MKLINYTEKWVLEFLDELLAERPNICQCEVCRMDMAAMALNRLKPNYTVSDHGRVYTKCRMLDQQNKIDIVTEIVKAIEKVSEHPHHLP